MKRQLLTGTLALSMLLGTTGMAFAAEVPAGEVKVEVNNMELAAVPMQSVTINTAGSLDSAAVTDDAFKVSDMKLHTVESYQLEIKDAKASLDEMVKAGQLTSAEADQALERMEKSLQEIKEGTLKLYYADMLDKDGNVVGQVSMMHAEPIVNAESGQEGATQYTVTAKK